MLYDNFFQPLNSLMFLLRQKRFLFTFGALTIAPPKEFICTIRHGHEIRKRFLFNDKKMSLKLIWLGVSFSWMF